MTVHAGVASRCIFRVFHALELTTMTIEEIKNVILDPAILEQWRQTAAEWNGTDQAGREACIAHVVGRREHILKSLQDISDADQMVESLAIVYIETKSEWIMLNTMVNYQLMRHGEGDGEAVLRAALVSSLLMTVERMLTPKDIQAITNFLAAPTRPPELGSVAA